MAATTDTKYFKVLGSDLEDDGTFTHHLRQVADFQGTPFTDDSAARFNHNTAQEIPRGTIVKIAVTTNIQRAVTLNPTS